MRPLHHRWPGTLVLACVAVAGLARPASAQVAPDTVAREGIAAFNRALDAATRRMDDTSMLALWEDDGVSLLPATAPLVGKPAIAAFLSGVSAAFPGGHMETFTNACHDVEISGAWATEWCVEHQVVLLPGGRRFEGSGKLLLVLHRGADGRWRLRREMWNAA
ncbi:MAG TPA: hypothetical protein VGD56_01380 [Gemmatirosa sp.]